MSSHSELDYPKVALQLAVHYITLQRDTFYRHRVVCQL